MENNDVVVINEGVKKRGRGGKYNFPNSQPPEDPEVVRAVLSECMYWYKRGFDKAVSDEDIENRTVEFFEYCIDSGERPTVEKYALALGYDRATLYKWECANDTRGNIIKKAKEFLASYDAGLVSVGKLNPVPYIFRAKNYYGMKDQTDLVVEPKSSLDNTISAEEVAAKYKELPED